MEKVKIYAKNKYGISIVKCCASCKFKMCDNRLRYCIKGEGTVPTDYLCSTWEMADGLSQAGKGGGRIKEKAYLDFFLNVMEHENRKAAYLRKSIDDIRETYNKNFGDIYIEGI